MRKVVALGVFVYIFVQLILEFYSVPGSGFNGKTFWDWMELLVIPFVLASGAFILDRSEKEIERKNAEGRANLEREIAKDRQQESALQTYLDRMSELLLEKKLQTTENEEVRDVARVRTLTVLRGLDPKRKGAVIKFLQEADLINEKETVISLKDADLREVDLKGKYIPFVNLENAILDNANLENANLTGSNLSNTHLKNANLYSVGFQSANLFRADIENANLIKADLTGATLTYAHFDNADCREAFFVDAKAIGAHFTGADLRDSKSENTNYTNADFKSANLKGAYLQGANLNNASVTTKQLEEVSLLENATMPDGTIHE